MEERITPTNSGGHRDPGLDFARGLAMLLMVAAHFSVAVVPHSWMGRAFHFAAYSAPAFFFFAFGMTFDFFLRKGAKKWTVIILFLYVALAHNAFRGSVFSNDVLGVLASSLAILAVLEMKGSRSNRFYAGLALIIFAALLLNHAIDYPMLQTFFSSTGRRMPLIPWIAFILAGLVFERTGDRRLRLAFSLSLMAAAMLLAWLLKGLPANEIFSKNPLSPAYLAFFLAMAMAMVETVRMGAWIYKRLPIMPGAIEYLSRNLLLATTMHYAAFLPVRAAYKLAVRNDEALMKLASQRDLATMAAGSALSIVILFALLPLVLKAWEKIATGKIMERLRDDYHVTAILMIVSMILAMHVRYFFFIEPIPVIKKLELSFTTNAAGYFVATFIGIAIMTYMALEMAEFRKRLKIIPALTDSQDV